MNTRISNAIFMFFVAWMYANGVFSIFVICGLDITSVFYPSVLFNILGFVFFMSINWQKEENSEDPKMANSISPPCRSSFKIPNNKIPYYETFDYNNEN